MTAQTFLPMDFVRYVGSKLRSVSGKVGEVVRKVQNTDELVVDFGGSAYIVDASDLARHSHKVDDDHRMRQIERKWKTSDASNKKGKKDQEAK